MNAHYAGGRVQTFKFLPKVVGTESPREVLYWCDGVRIERIRVWSFHEVKLTSSSYYGEWANAAKWRRLSNIMAGIHRGQGYPTAAWSRRDAERHVCAGRAGGNRATACRGRGPSRSAWAGRPQCS